MRRDRKNVTETYGTAVKISICVFGRGIAASINIGRRDSFTVG